MTNLSMRCSVIALCGSLLTLMVSFYGIIGGVIRTIEKLHLNGFVSFTYFTMLTNMLAALSAAFVLPYAIEGILTRRFILPAWLARMHYLATCSITITMVFVLFIMSWVSPADAFEGPNLFTHVFCPILILISFFQVENGYLYTARDWVCGCIPFCLYILVYVFEVFLIGEANGGWPDLYRIGAYVPPALAFPLALLYGVGVSAVIAVISNQLTKKRRERMFRYWAEDKDPIEIKIELYGLGRVAGLCAVKERIQLPFDIFDYFTEKYKLNRDELTKPYLTGFMNGLREKKPGRAGNP